MLEQLLAIARNTFVESIRQPIYLIMVGVGLIALILNPGLSTFTLRNDDLFMVDMGLATIFLCGLLIAAFIATSVVTREIEDKTVLALISKPVGRPVFVLGKFLGVTAAILVAATILSCALLVTIRHGVMETTRDDPDLPAIVFGVSALMLSVGIGVWCNFFYGWVFTSTTIGALLPLALAAWFGTLVIDETWQYQFLTMYEDHHETSIFLSPDFNPQIMMALGGVFMALIIVCAVAIAASTRLSQLMTVMACIAVFFAGLLSDGLFGRHAFDVRSLARLELVEVIRDLDEDFSDDGDRYRIRVDSIIDLREGMLVYIASDNTGLDLLGGPLETTGQPPAVVRNLSRASAELVKAGDSPMRRPPRVGDYLIEAPKQVNLPWRILWSIPPNFQSLFLVDALTQEHRIPVRHMQLLATYTGLYVAGMLGLAVILFQRREVG